MDIQLPQILFQIINFGVVLGALSYLLYKPIMKVLDERAKKIEDAQKAAQQAIVDQEQMEGTKKQIRQKAEKEAAKILEEAQKVADQKKAHVASKAKEEALKEVDRLREAWNEEKRKSLQDMKKSFADAVIAASEKVIGESVNAKAQSKLIDDEFAKLIKSI